MPNHDFGTLDVHRHATPEYAPQFGVYRTGEQQDIATVMGENARAYATLFATAPRLLRELQRARIALDFYGRLVAELSDGKTSYPNGQDVARDARSAIYDALGGDS